MRLDAVGYHPSSFIPYVSSLSYRPAPAYMTFTDYHTLGSSVGGGLD